MSDNTENPNVTGNTDLTTAQSVSSKVGVVTLEEELKKSFIDYAMSVIVDVC